MCRETNYWYDCGLRIIWNAATIFWQHFPCDEGLHIQISTLQNMHYTMVCVMRPCGNLILNLLKCIFLILIIITIVLIGFMSYNLIKMSIVYKNTKKYFLNKNSTENYEIWFPCWKQLCIITFIFRTLSSEVNYILESNL